MRGPGDFPCLVEISAVFITSSTKGISEVDIYDKFAPLYFSLFLFFVSMKYTSDAECLRLLTETLSYLIVGT